MSDNLTYQDYVSDEAYMAAYSEYQKKYAKKMRESDKRLIEIIRDLIGEDLNSGKQLSLLDVGCSTGNLLLHMKYAFPGLNLHGGDMVSTIIAECRNNPELEGINFEEMNALNIGHQEEFDLVVANAILYVFDQGEFDAVLESLAKTLKPNKWLIVFDWFHPFDQEITVVEKSRMLPNGFIGHCRGYSRVKSALKNAGFSDSDFQPFYMPIDLPRPDDPADVTTYTVRTDAGNRLSFRGTLFQPWCHLIARKNS